ncbi:hypothetical protein [Dactylosporangium sp. NPDC048998]|uniref:hypothetical protein n=1 Tax=Dactylosporangium sp. NPDC048998 TaxID=3363976 RepID=UPI003721F90C
MVMTAPGGSAQPAPVEDFLAFFAASDDQKAAAVVDFGPADTLDQIRCEIFDVIYAMVDWESAFTGRDVRELLHSGEPRVVADPCNGGPVVFVASTALHHGLAIANQAEIADVADHWVQTFAARDDILDMTTATQILHNLTRLARIAAAHNDRLYCWLP